MSYTVRLNLKTAELSLSVPWLVLERELSHLSERKLYLKVPQFGLLTKIPIISKRGFLDCSSANHLLCGRVGL